MSLGFKWKVNSNGPILVTGHTGFKGSWLRVVLDFMNIENFGMSLAPESDSLYKRINFSMRKNDVLSDISNLQAISEIIEKARPKAIIHLAAQSLVSVAYDKPLETFQTNVMGTVNVLQAATNSQSVEKIVIATTDKVYLNTNSGIPFVEGDELQGNEPYSCSKVGTESAVLAWQSSKFRPNLEIASVRAGNVIGGGDYSQDRLLPDIIKNLAAGTPIELRNPNSSRPWQHVLDPIFGYLMAMDKLEADTKIRSVNFGPSGKSLTVRRVAEIAKEVWGDKRIEIKEQEKTYFYESENLSLDSTLAKNTLGWEPCWSQEEAIKDTVLWWKSVLMGKVHPIEACMVDLKKAIDHHL